MTQPALYVLRHGETDWNVEGRLQGALDSPLTAKGRAQARRQADILSHAGVDAPIYSSPQGRARQTAQIIADQLGRHVVQNDALREVSMGPWDGQLITDVAPANPDDPVLWKFDAPGADRLSDMQNRLRAFVQTLDTSAVLVTHGVTSRVLRAQLLGVPDTAIASLPGGQGVVFRISQGLQRKLD